MTNQELQSLKNKFDIIGNDPSLNRALEIAVAVASTDLTVLICGESGTGKENVAKIIHQYSRRRTGKYFAVNCGAIPEGTIDSELFGHEKGAFTGASEMRKGYFEEADGGTLFLDEIGELPMASQAKLLRVLQSGEFIRVGSSKVLRSDVRVVAATNVNLMHAVSRGKFREDLYYRLNAVPVMMPALRERGDDIHLLFRKFASDFSEKYGMGKVSLTPDAVARLKSYRWPGNIRQLKNIAETVSALESEKISSPTKRYEIDAATLEKYIPKDSPNALPVKSLNSEETFTASEREAIIRTIYTLRQEVDRLNQVVFGQGGGAPARRISAHGEQPLGPSSDAGRFGAPQGGGQYQEEPDWQDADFSDPVGRTDPMSGAQPEFTPHTAAPSGPVREYPTEKVVMTPERDVDEQEVDDFSIEKAKSELIRKALEKYNGNRDKAAKELGMSVRTLYRRLEKDPELAKIYGKKK